jgi:hypothetical protein
MLVVGMVVRWKSPVECVGKIYILKTILYHLIPLSIFLFIVYFIKWLLIFVS